MLRSLAQWWDRKKVIGVVAAVAALIGLYGILSNQPLAGNDCNPPHELRHVYSPGRLKVIATCQAIEFRVVAFRAEHDGDVHVNGTVLGGGWTDVANMRGQHGLTVVEFVPGDPRPPKFFAGQTLRLTVTKVYDQWHRLKAEANGWIEGHPVFAARDVTPAGTRTRANRPQLVPNEP